MVNQTTDSKFTIESLEPGVYLFTVQAVNILGSRVETPMVVAVTGYCNYVFVLLQPLLSTLNCISYCILENAMVASTIDVGNKGMTMKFFAHI